MSVGTRYYDLNDKDTWQTPEDTVDDIRRGFGGTIDLDPCAGELTSHAQTNYRLEDGDDGLDDPWFGNVFINPPFSYKAEWLTKLVGELQIGRVNCAVMITPDATDTKSWWHEYIAEHAEYVCFKYGRLDYVDPVEVLRERYMAGHITRTEFETEVDEYLDDETTPTDVLDGDYDTPGATFGTAFSVFGDPPDRLLEILAEKGHLVETVTKDDLGKT